MTNFPGLLDTIKCAPTFSRVQNRTIEALADVDELRSKPGPKQQQFLVDVAASLAGVPSQLQRIADTQRTNTLLRQQDQTAREKQNKRMDKIEEKLDRLLKRQARFEEADPVVTPHFSSTLPFTTDKAIEDCLACVSYLFKWRIYSRTSILYSCTSILQIL